MENSTNLLNNVRIVLVETSHTGNMGSTARAMKTMGLSRLYLVNPIVKPDSQAIAMAAGASDIINHAVICSSLDEAIADCQLVIAASARSRTLDWPMLESRQSGTKVIESAKHAPVAIVFGRERVGLTNDELHKCHFHVAIAANPNYSSLNLAMAVQILAYEVRMAFLQQTQVEVPTHLTNHDDYPLSADMERFYQHLEQLLLQSGFIKQSHPGIVMSKLRRFFNRGRPERGELNILRGILTAFEKVFKNNSVRPD